ncbi:superfamily II DNA/RNA helicase [Paraburkholderia youngii]
MSFASLGLIDPLLLNVQGLNYQTPTPVQAKAIPAVLGGKDVMAGAQTGTGKNRGLCAAAIATAGAMRPGGVQQSRPCSGAGAHA